MAQKFPPHFSTCRKSRRRWDRTREGGKGRAEAAAATPRQLNGCARVRPWEVKLTKATNASSPFPHQTLALQPAPAGRPAGRRKANAAAEKAAKPPCLSLHPSLSGRGAGTSKEKPPPLPPVKQRGAATPTWGSKSCPRASLVCLRAGLQPGASRALIRAPATLKGCL